MNIIEHLKANKLMVIFCLLFSFGVAVADNSKNNPLQAKNEAVLREAARAAMKAGIQGPTTIPLTDQAGLDLPKQYIFIPRKEATALMQALGNRVRSEFLGIVVPEAASQWIITIDFNKSGYVKDGDAKEWKADELFNSLKAGTEEANKERAEKGFPTMEIERWIEPPAYNPSSHKLIWSIQARDSENDDVVNYNTYALGREGYFKLNLITSSASISQDKLNANKILSALHYNKNKRYEDYVKETDRVAEYGIAALVTGIVAKKLGLLALIGVFFMKIWKLLALACIAFSGKIKNLFTRKKS